MLLRMTRKRKIILGILIAIVVLIGGGVAAFSLRPEPKPETTIVSRATVVNDIDFTGRLQADQIADLGFEGSGTLQSLSVKVGDAVVAGQVLATQETSIASLELAKARADRLSANDAAQTELNTAISAQQATQAVQARFVESARQAVRNAKIEYDQAKVVWDKTVRENGDSSVTQSRYALVQSALSTYRAAQAALKLAEKEAVKANDAADGAVTASQVALQNIKQVAGGLSSLAASEQLASVRLAKQILRAPFAGVITDAPLTVGELAVGGEAVLTIQTIDQIEVVAQVPETDVASLAVGLPVTVSLDAYPDEQWSGNIASISPAAEIIEGVPTYEVTVSLGAADARLRPGLSATVTVRVNEKPNVIAIPRRAVVTSNGKKVVRIPKDDGSIEEREVKTGLQGSAGTIEIIEGLAEGETIIARQP